MIASRNGHLGTVKLLLKANANPNIRTPDGASALKWAADGKHDQIVEMLTKAGATK